MTAHLRRVIVIVRKWLELIVATLFDYGIADWKSTICQIVLACDHFSLLYALSPQVNVGVALGARQDQICLLKFVILVHRQDQRRLNVFGAKVKVGYLVLYIKLLLVNMNHV